MADVSQAPLQTADGRPLKAALAKAQARAKRRAFLLVLPLLAFVLLTFVLPILQMLQRSFYHDGFSANAPATVAWLEEHPQGSEIDETAYAALVSDLAAMQKAKTAGAAGTRINYTYPGTISIFKEAAREAAKLQPPYKAALVALDKKWEDPLLWVTFRHAASPWTTDFYMVSMDLRRSTDDGLQRAEPEMRIHLQLFVKTFGLSALITGLCLLLAFPIAHLLAILPMRKSNLLMILVLLPFWTSLLVRTSSWIALGQESGIVNDILVGIGIVADDNRIQMMYNKYGTILVMTHVLLPFMVLPLYSVMRVIPPSYARAARSLGATSWTTFRRIYLPQTLPGIAAGSLLVFILAVGYYITPALVGGADGTLISNLISFHMAKANWSQAAALAAMLLVLVLILYWLYDRLIGIDRLKLG
ncbi:ABC transporter permease [Stagnihabitans tardus]|uniref:ABC transporter permease subunit n=1 Tax=Stagnihabitans tardus TaxID=2699202 RepID=A0AAE4Y5J3_9RHOB|nr:ABC transporter permease [Stagnihabitans tardus]NBZ86131.1 ABC transporter permease subunit [Stagnihabitans tardus]